MKSSCISHPPQQPLLIIRQWQLEVTGNPCAAALLSFFEHWHNFKIDAALKAKESNLVRQRHGEEQSESTSHWQFHSADQLSDGIMKLYSRDAIRKGIEKLVELGFLETGRNPNPKYKFDATRHFLFRPAAVRHWLSERYAENRTWDARISSLDAENRQRDAEISGAIPEITSETSSQNDEDKSSSMGTARKEALKTLSIRIGSIMKRREATQWSAKEKKALAALYPIPEEDIAAVEKYYSAPIQIASDYRRRDVFTLLNNWPGEVDRANGYKAAPVNGKTGPDKSNPRHFLPDGSPKYTTAGQLVWKVDEQRAREAKQSENQ